MNVQLTLTFEDGETNTVMIQEEDVKEMFMRKKISPMEFMRVPKCLRTVTVPSTVPVDEPGGVKVISGNICVVVEETCCYTINIQKSEFASTCIQTNNYEITIQAQSSTDEYVIAVHWTGTEEIDQNIALAHFDDGKENIDSHEVSLKDTEYNLCPDFSGIIGYGETYEEAFEEFVEEFNSLMKKLTVFQKKLNDKDLRNKINVIETDCVGQPVNTREVQ